MPSYALLGSWYAGLKEGYEGLGKDISTDITALQTANLAKRQRDAEAAGQALPVSATTKGTSGSTSPNQPYTPDETVSTPAHPYVQPKKPKEFPTVSGDPTKGGQPPQMPYPTYTPDPSKGGAPPGMPSVSSAIPTDIGGGPAVTTGIPLPSIPTWLPGSNTAPIPPRPSVTAPVSAAPGFIERLYRSWRNGGPLPLPQRPPAIGTAPIPPGAVVGMPVDPRQQQTIQGYPVPQGVVQPPITAYPSPQPPVSALPVPGATYPTTTPAMVY